jgi:hypothetical protein
MSTATVITDDAEALAVAAELAAGFRKGAAERDAAAPPRPPVTPGQPLPPPSTGLRPGIPAPATGPHSTTHRHPPLGETP